MLSYNYHVNLSLNVSSTHRSAFGLDLGELPTRRQDLTSLRGNSHAMSIPEHLISQIREGNAVLFLELVRLGTLRNRRVRIARRHHL